MDGLLDEKQTQAMDRLVIRYKPWHDAYREVLLSGGDPLAEPTPDSNASNEDGIAEGLVIRMIANLLRQAGDPFSREVSALAFRSGLQRFFGTLELEPDEWFYLAELALSQLSKYGSLQRANEGSAAQRESKRENAASAETKGTAENATVSGAGDSIRECGKRLNQLSDADRTFGLVFVMYQVFGIEAAEIAKLLELPHEEVERILPVALLEVLPEEV